jgi:hypothetical protein
VKRDFLAVVWHAPLATFAIFGRRHTLTHRRTHSDSRSPTPCTHRRTRLHSEGFPSASPERRQARGVWSLTGQTGGEAGARGHGPRGARPTGGRGSGAPAHRTCLFLDVGVAILRVPYTTHRLGLASQFTIRRFTALLSLNGHPQVGSTCIRRGRRQRPQQPALARRRGRQLHGCKGSRRHGPLVLSHVHLHVLRVL